MKAMLEELADDLEQRLAELKPHSYLKTFLEAKREEKTTSQKSWSMDSEQPGYISFQGTCMDAIPKSVAVNSVLTLMIGGTNQCEALAVKASNTVATSQSSRKERQKNAQTYYHNAQDQTADASLAMSELRSVEDGTPVYHDYSGYHAFTYRYARLLLTDDLKRLKKEISEQPEPPKRRRPKEFKQMSLI